MGMVQRFGRSGLDSGSCLLGQGFRADRQMDGCAADPALLWASRSAVKQTARRVRGCAGHIPGEAMGKKGRGLTAG